MESFGVRIGDNPELSAHIQKLLFKSTNKGWMQGQVVQYAESYGLSAGNNIDYRFLTHHPQKHDYDKWAPQTLSPQEFVEKCGGKWEPLTRDDEPTSPESWIISNQVRMDYRENTRPAKKEWVTKQHRCYKCRLTSPKLNGRMEVPEFWIAGEPTIEDVISCLHADSSCPTSSFDEFVREFLGENPEDLTIKEHKRQYEIWENCKEQTKRLHEWLGKQRIAFESLEF